MATGFNRDAAERRATRDIRKHFLDARGRWEDILRRKNWNPRRLPRTFTDRERDLLAAVLLRRMLDTAQTSFHETNADRNVPAGTVGNRVVDRLKTVSNRMAESITADTAYKLRKGRTAEPSSRRAAFEAAFGTSRAESIAITSTTASRSTGQLATALTLLDGEDVTYEWVTADDGRVCPVCGPLHNQPESVWRVKFPNGPPAHPRCRCDLQARFRTKRRGR